MTDEMRLEQAAKAFETVCATFDSRKWPYEKKEDALRVCCTAAGKNGPIRLTLEVDPDRLLIRALAELDFSLDPEKMLDCAIAVCTANYGLTDGCFEYDGEKNKIVFRMAMAFVDATVGQEAILYMFRWACGGVNTFGEQLKAVNEGTLSGVQFLEERQ